MLNDICKTIKGWSCVIVAVILLSSLYFQLPIQLSTAHSTISCPYNHQLSLTQLPVLTLWLFKF